MGDTLVLAVLTAVELLVVGRWIVGGGRRLHRRRE